MATSPLEDHGPSPTKAGPHRVESDPVGASLQAASHAGPGTFFAEEGLASAEVVRDEHDDPIDGIFDFVDPAFEALLGLPAGSILGRSLGAVFSDAGRRLRIVLRKVILGGEEQRLETHPDGSGRWLELRIFQKSENRLDVTLRNITQPKELLGELRNRDAILTALGYASEQLLLGTDWEWSIQGILARVGQGVGVGRVYVFQNHRDELGALLGSQRHEWVAEGVSPQIDNPELQNVPYLEAGFGRWAKLLGCGEAIYGHVRDFPDGEREFLAAQDIASILVVPVNLGSEFWGFMGFDSYQVERNWSNAERDALMLVAATLGAVMHRKEAEEQIRRETARAEALTRTAASLNAKIDLDSVLATVCREIALALKAPGVSVMLYDPQESTYWIAADQGFPFELRTQAARLPSDLVKTLTDGSSEVIMVPDVQALPELPAWDLLRSLDLRTFLLAPMVRDDEPIGALGINTFGEPREFTPDELTLLRGLADQAAQAITNAVLFDQIRARNDELSTLISLISRLRESRTEAEMLPVALAEIRSSVRFDSSLVLLEDTDRMTFLAAYADGSLERLAGCRFERDGDLVQLLAKRERSAGASKGSTSSQALCELLGIRPGVPAVDVPLQSEIGQLGTLVLARDVREDQARFSAAEIRLLSAVGEMIGNGLRRARLSDSAQRRLERTQALREIDKAIIESPELRTTLNVILGQVVGQLQVDAADILLLDEETEMLEFAAGSGFRTKALRHTRLPLGEGWAGIAARERRTILIQDMARGLDGLERAPLLPNEGFLSYCAVPLIAKGKVEGVLEIFRREQVEPDREWVDFLEAMAGQAAIAIDNASLLDDLHSSNVLLSEAYNRTLEGWSRALDLRDKETEGHTQRVTEMTLKLAVALAVDPAAMDDIRRGALLHDIGKMGIPDAILLKPGPLSESEWEVMRRHPTYAYELLAPIEYLLPALDIPYCHHERWDGKGYPRGLKGEAIPLAARIFAVVDVWDALRSDRPYRAAWPEDSVHRYLREQAGRHFDPVIVDTFMKILAGTDPSISPEDDTDEAIGS